MKRIDIIVSCLFLVSVVSTAYFWRPIADVNPGRNGHAGSYRLSEPKPQRSQVRPLNSSTTNTQNNDWDLEPTSTVSKKDKAIRTSADQPEEVAGAVTSTIHGRDKQGRDSNLFDTARSSSLTPLRPVDREFYTIRLNTWHRHKQLIASIKHHSMCEGVAQIQVIWKESGDPPKRVLKNPKVVIEKHTENKLNERFNILIPTPTLGILSIDDDVLYSCEAVDMAFHAWTKSPARQVGFDRRRHKVKSDGRWEVR